MVCNLTAFHDLTHGGSEHVKMRVLEGSVEPAYPESELTSLVKFSNEVRIRVGAELLARIGNENSLEELSDRAQILRDLP